MARNTVSYWATDVPISLPLPPQQPVAVLMDGFAFTEGGIAHDISDETFRRLSTPDFTPEKDQNIIWEDADVDQPVTSMEVF